MKTAKWMLGALLISASCSAIADYAVNECLRNAHGQTYPEQLVSAVECFNTINSPNANKIASCVHEASGDNLRQTINIIQFCMLETEKDVMLDAINCARKGRGTTVMQRIDSSRWCLTKLPL